MKFTSKTISPLTFTIISLISLFISFQFNFFHVTNTKWFQSYQYDSEALVIGRLAESSRNGIFSHSGQLGFVSINHLKYGCKGFFEGGEKAYLDPVIKFDYKTYNSQFGIQGLFFSLTDKLLNFLHISPEIHLKIFHMLTSLFLAIVLTGILYLFYLEFGLIPASITLLGILSSEWLIVFGKNLYWIASLWFLPMLVVMYFLHLEKNKISISWGSIAVIIFLSVFIKSLNGYEYITTILIAMVTPIVYYAVSLQWTWKKYIQKTLLVGISGLFGFIFAFMFHIGQLFLVTNDISKAFSLIYQRITIRTFMDASTLDASSAYMASANAEVFIVLKRYLGGHFFHGHFKFIFLILIIVLVSALGIYIMKRVDISIAKKRTLRALLYTTWFSILAPISWFVLAKGHSFIHVHMNFVLWYLPFMIFGFLLIGYISNIFISKKYNIVQREE